MKGHPVIRVGAWVIALALVALPVVGVLEGWFAVDRWPIRQLQVEAPYQHVDEARIRAVVTPLIAQGFFATDLESVQAALMALPWVQSAEARKRWPDTLALRVTERQPFAHWNHDQFVSRHEQLFKVPGAAEIRGLPQLSGPDARMRDVVAFFTKARERFAGSGLDITGAHLSGRDSWSLELAGGAEIMIGRTRPEQRLQRFLGVYRRYMARSGEHFDYVDLRYPNGFAMRWSAPAAPAVSGGIPNT